MTNDTKSMTLLDWVQEPENLRRLHRRALPRLAREVREEILSNICDSGGHLASSLGVVELTIALHYIFNTPDDKIVWDVGHQCYPHKLLTARRDRFPGVRSYGGISGFPKRSESEYDTFGVGHASTSISAAMGMAEALNLSGDPSHVVAVIGDGGLTGGQALEALNQIHPEVSNLTVILNDNEMSIAPSVGSMSTFLSRSMVNRHAFDLVRKMRRLARPLPRWLYEELSWLGRRWRQSFLSFWTPGGLFESFGFHYIGPVDGHRFEQLLPALRQARDVEEPFLIHVLTKKGKGYYPAEKNPCAFHGIGPFDLATGACPEKQGPPSYTEIFARSLVRLMENNRKLVGITAAMPQGTGMDKVMEAHPGRVFDLGITEPHCVTFSAGMACQGYRPVVAIYSTFLQRAYDQLIHDVCLQELPVIFALDRGGIVGEDGPTHHGVFDLAYLRSMPNMAVMAPADENELGNMLHTAVELGAGPVAIRYPRGKCLGMVCPPEFETLEWGKAEVRREGSGLAIFAVGAMVGPAEEAARELAKEGIEAAVINARFVKPLDEDLVLDYARRTGKVLTVEENNLPGGFGSAVLELLSDAGLDQVSALRHGIKDVFVAHGTPAQLRKDHGLDAEGIADAARRLVVRGESEPLRAASGGAFSPAEN